jgi:hypothetical protein
MNPIHSKASRNGKGVDPIQRERNYPADSHSQIALERKTFQDFSAKTHYEIDVNSKWSPLHD